MRKTALKCMIITTMFVLLVFEVVSAGTGSGFAVQGDLLPQSFPEEGKEKADAMDKYISDLYKMTKAYTDEHDLRLLIAAFTSLNSMELNYGINGSDIGSYADSFVEKAQFGEPASNAIYLIYLENTNEFAYRTVLNNDDESDINWDLVREAFCNNDDIQTKIRNVCNIIITGEAEQTAGSQTANIAPWMIVLAIGLAIVVFVLIIIAVNRRKKNNQ